MLTSPNPIPSADNGLRVEALWLNVSEPSAPMRGRWNS